MLKEDISLSMLKQMCCLNKKKNQLTGIKCISFKNKNLTQPQTFE